MDVQDIMTRRVVTIGPAATVIDAARLMLNRRVSSLPVVAADGRLIGLVTEGDLLRRTKLHTEKNRARWVEILLGPGLLASEFTRTHGLKIEDIMTRDPYSVTEDATLEDIVTIMEGHNVKRVPVLRHGKVIGIISRRNLLSALLRNVQYGTKTGATDLGIRNKIVSRMEDGSWAPTACVDVQVSNGVVTLRGTILDERDRTALKVLAENVDGVSAVRDELYGIGPYADGSIGPEKSIRDDPRV